MPMRADRHFAQIGKIAGLHQQPAQPQHVQSFGHSLRHARRLNDQISSPSMSETADKIQAFRRGSYSRH